MNIYWKESWETVVSSLLELLQEKTQLKKGYLALLSFYFLSKIFYIFQAQKA